MVDVAMLLPLALLVLTAGEDWPLPLPDASAVPPPALIWCSTPVLPNETAVVQGSGFGAAPRVTVEPHASPDEVVVVVPLTSS